MRRQQIAHDRIYLCWCWLPEFLIAQLREPGSEASHQRRLSPSPLALPEGALMRLRKTLIALVVAVQPTKTWHGSEEQMFGAK
jgi:hypothetical protein